MFQRDPDLPSPSSSQGPGVLQEGSIEGMVDFSPLDDEGSAQASGPGGKGGNYAALKPKHPWPFLLPAFLVMLLVAAWPLVRTISLSFMEAELSTMTEATFAGLGNYMFVFDDPDWYKALSNTLAFTLWSVSLETLLGVAVALLLHRSFRGRFLVRTAVLIPWAIPTVVSAKMWGWMLHDIYGIINTMLMTLHVISAPVAWTASGDLAFYAVVLVDVWKTTPFMALMVLAGLQMLPKECFEAARVDGIHPLKLFTKVTLPLLMPTLVVAVIFRTLDALRIFDLIYVLTSGSPDTMSLSIYARQQLVDFQNVGVGSAASTVLFTLIAVISIIYIYIGRRFQSDA